MDTPCCCTKTKRPTVTSGVAENENDYEKENDCLAILFVRVRVDDFKILDMVVWVGAEG